MWRQYFTFVKACFTFILRPFVRANLLWATEHRDREADCRQFRTESHRTEGSCTMLYNYLPSHGRLPKDGHAEFARLLQDKAISRTVPTLQLCDHCAIFSCSCTFCSIFAVALQ